MWKEGVGECSVWDIRNLRASFIQVIFNLSGLSVPGIDQDAGDTLKKGLAMVPALMEIVGLVGQTDKNSYN